VVGADPNKPREAVIVTLLTKRGTLANSVRIVALAAMPIAFALGYILHP
jgi:hypothetical protein